MAFEFQSHQRLIKAALYDRECELLGTIIAQGEQIEELQRLLAEATRMATPEQAEPQDEHAPTPIARRKDYA